jgi:phosphoadenosine phosphosulfate reductase
MLVENTLFGIEDKIKIAIERIKYFEQMAINIDPAGYYVCISGGKDSSVIMELCMMAGVQCEFIHNHTSVDNPLTVYFVRDEIERLKMELHGRYSLRIEYPRFKDGKQKTMFGMIPKRGLPTMIQRWCCAELKEYGGLGRYCITGVRWEESPKRKANRASNEIYGKEKKDNIILNNDNDMMRRLSESCIPKRKFILNPIIDWTENDVWDFIKKRCLPYNPLYNMGFKRVGCIGCPMAKKDELEQYPKYKSLYYKAACRYIEHRKALGLVSERSFENADIYFNWWRNL